MKSWGSGYCMRSIHLIYFYATNVGGFFSTVLKKQKLSLIGILLSRMYRKINGNEFTYVMIDEIPNSGIGNTMVPHCVDQ